MKTYHVFTFDLWRCTPVRRLLRRGRVGIPVPCARPTRAAQKQAARKVRLMRQEEHPLTTNMPTVSSPAVPHPAEMMFAHLRVLLDHHLTLRELAMLYYLAQQPRPIGHAQLVQALGIPDSSGTVRAIINGPVASGWIDQLPGKNRRGKQCWLYALKPAGRRLLRLPTENSEPNLQ